MKNKFNRLTALILALVMCLSLSSMTALAAEVDSSEPIAESSEEQYKEIAEILEEPNYDETEVIPDEELEADSANSLSAANVAGDEPNYNETEVMPVEESETDSADSVSVADVAEDDDEQEEENSSTDDENPNIGDSDIDEDASDELVLKNDATKLEDGTIQLTELATWQSGSAWYGHQIDATSGFTTTFSYWAGGGRDDSYGGADGMVLTFSEETTLGANGGYLGFVGTGAYGVELDSYPHNSNDPNSKHIAIIKDSASNHLAYILDDRVDDSAWHTLTVTYDYESTTLDVYLDNEALLSSEDIELPENVYLGISASTGAGKNQHLIKDFFIKGVVSISGSFEEDNIPIIVIPGIMGSKLYSDEACTKIVWGTEECVTKIWQQNGSKLDINNPLWTTGLSLVEEKQREYGTTNTYAELVDFLYENHKLLNKDGTNVGRKVYFFSYDWRQSNVDSANVLRTALKQAGIEKADFVCHSMGGLVISQYLQLDNTTKETIQHVITLGTPYEGATKLIKAVVQGYILSDSENSNTAFLGDPLLCLGGLSYDIRRNLAGVGELSPTQELWATTETISSIDVFESNRWLRSILYDALLSYIFDIKEDIVTAQDSVQSAIGELLAMDNAYFAVGNADRTLVALSIRVTNSTGAIKIVDAAYGKGDGTVPFDSAVMLQSTLPERFSTFSLNHSALAGDMGEETTNTEAQEWKKEKQWIHSILKNISTTTEPSNPQNTPYTVIRIACPVEATIKCGDEVLSSNFDKNFCDQTSFGCMDLIGTSGEIKMFCIDSAANYDVTLNGTDNGTMDYTIRFFDADDNLYDERTFEAVPITADTIITTGTDENEDTVLLIDNDGDGTVDNTWTASENEDVTEPDEDHAHSYIATFNWSDNNEFCSATFTCVDGDDQQILDCTVTDETTDPTCTEAGTITYTATVDFEGSSYTDSQTVEGEPATGHTSVEAVKEKEIPATCTENGSYDSVVYCSVCQAEISRETVDVPATGHHYQNGVCTVCGDKEPADHTHTYGAPAFTWTVEGKGYACSATFTCVDGDDQQILDCTVTSKTTPATAKKDGKTVYTASVEFEGKTYTDTKTVVLPATGSVDPGFDHNSGWKNWFRKWFHFGGNDQPDTPDAPDTPDTPDEPEKPSRPTTIWGWLGKIFHW